MHYLFQAAMVIKRKIRFCTIFGFFFGGVAKLRKETVRFVMSVCLSVNPPVRVEQLVPHWMNFH